MKWPFSIPKKWFQKIYSITSQEEKVQEEASKLRRALGLILKIGISRVPNHLVIAAEACVNEVQQSFVSQGALIKDLLKRCETLEAENTVLLHANDLLQKRVQIVHGETLSTHMTILVVVRLPQKFFLTKWKLQNGRTPSDYAMSIFVWTLICRPHKYINYNNFGKLIMVFMIIFLCFPKNFHNIFM